jgi:hypothetical protein
MKTSPNESAFSKAAFYHPDGGIDTPQSGLTIREYFAAVALQGILANPQSYSSAPTQIAKYAVDQADLLIDELNKETN